MFFFYQIRIIQVNKKLDIWSMGIILYNMVYGKLPLAHIKTFPKKMFAICDPSKKEFTFPPVDNPFVLDVIHVAFVWLNNIVWLKFY